MPAQQEQQMQEQRAQEQPQTRRIDRHRAQLRERRAREVTVDFPECAAFARLARYMAVLEALARNDGEGARQVTGMTEYDTSIYLRDATVGGDEGIDAVDLLLGRAARFSVECAIFAKEEARRVAASIERFLEGKQR